MAIGDRTLLIVVETLLASGFHLPLHPHHRQPSPLSATQAAQQPAPSAALARVEALGRSGSKAEFDAGVASLVNPVEAVRALDLALPDGLITTTTFAAALEAIAARAPAAACAPLVGHAISRLKKRPNATEACMDDTVLSPLASALLKARSNTQALTAIDAISGEKSARDYRVGIVTAARLDDAIKVRKLLQSALQCRLTVASCVQS